MENIEPVSKYRDLSGISRKIWITTLFLIPLIGVNFILSIPERFGLVIFKEQYAGLFLGLALAATYIGIQNSRKRDQTRVPWFDWILTIAGLIVGLYITINYPTIILQFSNITTERFIISLIAYIVIIEALRRLFGWLLVGVVGIFTIYAFVGPFLNGPLRSDAISTEFLFNYLYLDTNSLLSMVYLAATIILAFVLFGQVLLAFKGSDIFNNVAIRLFGKYRGGPAKASIIGSGMVGSVSGDPVSNVILTGNMSIPLMKKVGYSSREAGAIESLASTAGSVTPPIMGVLTFMMAENLGVPYTQVVLAATLPAILYYLSLFVQVDLKAAYKGIKGIAPEHLPNRKLVLKTGWIFIPIFGLFIYFLFFKGSTPSIAGVYSAGIAILLLLLFKEARTKIFYRIGSTLIETGKIISELGVILAVAGIIAGLIGVTGLGFNLINFLTSIGEENIVLLLITCAISCIILGMGMPALVAYAIVAAMVTPALIELGINPMAAHLFVVYFALVSNFTLPIALACFAAAPIAKEKPNAISLTAMKMGTMVYVIPFLFVIEPTMLIAGESYTIYTIFSIATTFAGVIILCTSIVGFYKKKMFMISRLILALFATMMFIPTEMGTSNYGIWVNIVGLAGALIIIISNYFHYKRDSISVVNEYANRP